MSEIILNNSNFNEEVLNYKGLVLVDFWANWCGPCKMLAPIIHEVSQECSEVKVGKVDVDQEFELAQKYRVMSIPTLILFKDGEVVKQQVGLVSKTDIEKMWKDL